jgi:hypothetical protein
MPTVVLDAYSKAYSLITNRIRAAVSTETSPLSIVASIIDTTSGHPARTWHFAGLLRDNYRFSLDEIDGSDNPINNLALFDVVPGAIDGVLVRDDEQIQVDVTTGFVGGANTFTFDGTGGKPNYIGWEIVPSELTGRGILVKGLDYSWDSVTGILTLLQAGDVFPTGNYWNIHFDPKTVTAGAGVSNVTDFQIRLITTDETLTVDDFGKKLIVEPSGVYIELSLPDISTVADGRPVMIDVMASSICCVKIIPNGADTINWIRGNVYILPNESLKLYKFTRSAGVYEWRITDADGNFKSVGELVGDDLTTVFNKQFLDGTIRLITQYARIYNEVVLNLPGTQVVNFDSWITGNNKYFYSLANSADPSNAGKFHFPDRRGIFERNNNAGKAGDYQDEMVGSHLHHITGSTTTSFIGGGKVPAVSGGSVEDAGNTDLNTGTETRPKNYLINKYVLL